MNYFDYVDINSKYILIYWFIMLISSSIFIFVFNSNLIKSKQLYLRRIRARIYDFYDVNTYDKSDPYENDSFKPLIAINYYCKFHLNNPSISSVSLVKPRSESRKFLFKLLFERIQGNQIPLPSLKEIFIIHPLKTLTFYDLIKVKLELEVDQRMLIEGRSELQDQIREIYTIMETVLNIRPTDIIKTIIENDFKTKINRRIIISKLNFSNEQLRLWNNSFALINIVALISYIHGNMH